MELGPAVLAVVGTWLASRVAVLVVSLLGARAVSNPPVGQVPDLVGLWDHWDAGLFAKVAEYGYLSPAYSDPTEVDFPGMPLAMRVVHPLVGDWVVAGMLVSLIAGLLASAALWRLAVDDHSVPAGGVGGVGSPGVGGSTGIVAEDLDRGRRAVLLLVCSPYAVFLFAGYSEALFLAFATTAWVAARRQRWALAGLCAAGATGTRIIGVALVAGLVVEYAVQRWRARDELPLRSWRTAVELGWLVVVPLAPLVAFAAYFQARTGHWDAYTRAMRDHWQRGVDWPWAGLETTVRAALAPGQGTAYQVFWCAELAAVAIGVLLTAVLLSQARWGEATYVGVCTLIISCSTYWASGVRAVLVWFPLYVLLARRPRLLAPCLWVGAPAAAVFVLAFTRGVWVD
ncbi:MAG: hypothetical protein QOG60_2102 [Frankiaceae bacterium]|nr:hypothetical protein [Frankiaceae bacterium]